jgi:5-methylcytosine-specific restriction endonuclease McrA
MREKAEKVDGIAARLRTPNTIFEVPSVLRLKRYTHVPRRFVTLNKRNILRRDRYICAYCGVQVGDKRDGIVVKKHDFTIDHIVPLSKGGKSTWANLVSCCHPCNHRKGARTPHQAGLRLLWEPKRPRTSYLVVSSNVPPAWKFYLNI